MPRSCSFAAVTGPTPHSRSTGSGWRKASSRSGGTTSSPSGLATPLATLARNFVLATPTVMARPTASSTSRRSRVAISVGEPDTRRSPPTSRKASSIERPSTSGVVSSNTCEDGLAGLGVGRHPGRDHRWRPGTAGAPAAASHRRAHAVGLGLVAGRQHHAHADDHRPAPQPGIVPLLDRGVEGVEVGVEDRRRVGHEQMFAQGCCRAPCHLVAPRARPVHLARERHRPRRPPPARRGRPMIFEQHYLECLSQASYLIGDETTGRAVVVDPRRDISPYLESAAEHGLQIELVIETHFHADFLSGHLELAAATGATIAYGSAADTEFESRQAGRRRARLAGRRRAGGPPHPWPHARVDQRRGVRARRRRRAVRRPHRRHAVRRRRRPARPPLLPGRHQRGGSVARCTTRSTGSC